MLFAIDLHEDFIDEEGIAVAMMLSLQSPGEPGTELDTPEPNGVDLHRILTRYLH